MINLMETQYKESNGEGAKSKDVGVANRRRRVNCCEFFLRFLALALTLAATVLVGVNKQTKIVSVTVVSTLSPVNIPVDAKWHYMSAFVYFVVANAIACSYAAISLLLTLANKGGKRSLSLVIIIMDLLMVALLYSSNGAALAVGILGYQGNSHVRWPKVCNVFDRFCHQVAAATILSLVGAIAYLMLIIFATSNLHKMV